MALSYPTDLTDEQWNLIGGLLPSSSMGATPPTVNQSTIGDRQVQSLRLETGPPLGLDERAFFPEFELLLRPDDLILLYTDGITEAINPQGEMFSEVRLIQSLASSPAASPARVVRMLQYFLRQFVVDAPQSDDMTLLVLKYQPSSLLPPDMKSAEWSLTVNSELTELERVHQRLGEMLQEEGIAVEIIEDIQLIAEEILVNVIQHGHTNPKQQQIDLHVRISSGTLSMVFEDGGQPFNPLMEITTPDLSMDDEQRAQGGLGFYLVQELSEQIDYCYQEGKNRLTISKILTSNP